MPDLQPLAGELGISEKDLKKLERKYGKSLELVLRRWQRACRDEPRLLRRSLPRGTRPTDELSEGSTVKAAEESGYTHSPYSALTMEAEAVSWEFQQEISRTARHNWGILRAEEQTKQRARSVSNQIRELTTRSIKAGIDPKLFLDAIQKAAQEQDRRLDRAA